MCLRSKSSSVTFSLFIAHSFSTPILAPPRRLGGTMQTTAPAAKQAIRKSYLVQVHFANTGKRCAYRWPTRSRATACAKDFPSAKVTITEAWGYMTFEGWVQVQVQVQQGGAA